LYCWAILYHDEGDFVTAEKAYQDVLIKRRQIYDETRKEVLDVQHSLANLYFDQGETDKAIVLMNECLEKAQNNLGIDYHEYQSSLQRFKLDS
jgi:tetratricopeptide (TPR) repeat protein